MRKYGFKADEIPLDSGGNLSLGLDPKEVWAKLHPEFFPVNINKADKYRPLRIPGLGQIIVERILSFKKEGIRLRSLGDLGKQNKLLRKAQGYVTF